MERPNPRADFEDFTNCLYFSTVTITTTGYGDYVPITHFGRLATLILMIVGIVNINFVNYSMIEYLDLNNQESMAFNLLEK